MELQPSAALRLHFTTALRRYLKLQTNWGCLLDQGGHRKRRAGLKRLIHHLNVQLSPMKELEVSNGEMGGDNKPQQRQLPCILGAPRDSSAMHQPLLQQPFGGIRVLCPLCSQWPEENGNRPRIVETGSLQ